MPSSTTPPESHERLVEHYSDSPQFDFEFDYFWKELSFGMDSLVDEETLLNLRQQAKDKERSFYDKVYKAVGAAVLASQDSVVCLFDIDGTIGEVKEEDNSPLLHTLLRPTFAPLVARLATENTSKLKFGLFSLRPLRHLEEEVENPTFLTPVRAYIDEGLVYSAEDATKNDPYLKLAHPQVNSNLLHSGLTLEQLDDCLNDLSGVIDPKVLEYTRKGDIDLFDWYDPKLRVLSEMHDSDPDITYIVVDDLGCVSLLNPENPKLVGVCVREEKQILLP